AVEVLGGSETQHGRVYRARADRIHPDAVLGMIESHGTGQRQHSSLGGDIGRDIGLAGQALHRRDVDDGAAALPADVRYGVVGGEVGPLQVDVEGKIPVVLAHGLDSAIGLHRSAVDHDVETAEV